MMTTDTMVIVLTIIATFLGSLYFIINRVNDTRQELKVDIDGVRQRLKADIYNTRKELKADIGNVRQELKADIGNVRQELKVDIDGVRQASATAHEKILVELSDIKIQQAAHTERLNCIEKLIDRKHQEENKE